jgi:AraC family transcriptional regulator, regulatory protein of adaptative response / methylated-DNA-[protein]-cysteine methyltransferase
MKSQADYFYATDQARWEALVRRDRNANGVFVYGVLTTFVYCRPVCPSRLPKYQNIRFFDTCKQAERAGFRPCKRCHPTRAAGHENHSAAIVKACHIIESREEHVPLKNLASEVGLSPFHFQRLFKKNVGITPKQYAMETRFKQVRAGLQKKASVTEAIYEAGFGSSSRFYENAEAVLGMKPSEYRQGATGVDIRFAVAKSPLGWVLIAATVKGICAIEFGDGPDILERRLRERFSKARILDNDDVFKKWVEQILAHLESPQRSLNLPLDIRGTAFQRLVWKVLREIPPGSTASYTDIAEKIGRPKAARAVARACASNKIAVAIPCHRVVRRSGRLGGYRWGTERKRAMLEREAGLNKSSFGRKIESDPKNRNFKTETRNSEPGASDALKP